MNETTKTLLGDVAIAGGVAICVGAIVACASWPIVAWWHERRSDRRAAGPSLAAVPVVDGSGAYDTPDPSCLEMLDDEIARTARRVIAEQDLVG